MQQVVSDKLQLPKKERDFFWLTRLYLKKGTNTEPISTSGDRNGRDGISVHEETADPDYPDGLKLTLLVIGVLCTVFLVSLE